MTKNKSKPEVVAKPVDPQNPVVDPQNPVVDGAEVTPPPGLEGLLNALADDEEFQNMLDEDDEENKVYTMTDYLNESERTVADPKSVQKALMLIHNVTDPAVFNKSMIGRLLFRIMTVGNEADIYKRATFYGDDKVQSRLTKQAAVIAELNDALYAKDPDMSDDFTINMMHAIWGMMSELGEISEELVRSKIEKREPDFVNLKEESGDILWYLAMFLRQIGTTFEDTAETNINKLKIRYPEKFTTENAIDRDLAAEQQALTA